MSKRMNTPEESCIEPPKSARVSDGARTSNDSQLVLGLARYETFMTTQLVRLDSWRVSLNGYIAQVKILIKSGQYTGDSKTTLDQALIELYSISRCMREIEVIVNGPQKAIASSFFKVAKQSDDVGENWDLVEIFCDRLETGEDWIEFQKTGGDMRLAFLESAKRLIKALSDSMQGQSRPTSANSNSSEKSHNSSRVERWTRLNDVLRLAGKQKRNDSSTPCSSISWDQVSCIFSTTHYEQPQKDIGEERAQFLKEYLYYVTKCMARIGGEAQRIHLIAPILFCVGSLLDEVQIQIEKELKGDFIEAHGRFDFVIKRRNKIIGIVEAKKENIDQGMAQDLVGCELAAERERLDVVYGIVTNYVEWVFLRNTNDEIFEDRISITTTCHGPQTESLKMVTDKIYAILSDVEQYEDSV
jgi:hypothetical protein